MRGVVGSVLKIVTASAILLSSIFFSPLAKADLGNSGPEIAGLATSENFSCMNAKTGEVYCWGQSTNSNLGTGMETDNAVPHKVYEIKDSIKVDTGDMFACSLGKSGLVSCWGKNDAGQVGDGFKDSADRVFPSYVAVVRDVIDITLGDKHACALNNLGKVYCWGDNKFGQLGNFSQPTSNLIQVEPFSILPIEIAIPETVVSITSGSNHTCALTKSGFVYCWGSNLIGQLGLGLQNISISAPRVVPALSGVIAIKSHYDSTCANASASGLYCWGKGINGELGETERVNRFLPRLMSGTYSITNATTNVATSYTYATSLTKFAFGTNGGCGIDGKSGFGYLVCWGANTAYEPAGIQALDVALGKNHGCIITISYTVACWGSNLYGQTGSNIKSATMQKIAVLKGIPEWRNYVLSWGISYTNNVATITWTGAAESKFVLYVEPFGYVCEATTVLNCQVGQLDSQTTYKALLIARGSTQDYSRFAIFSFTTGNLITAVDEYQAKLIADAKAALEKSKLEAASLKLERDKAKVAALVDICNSNKDVFAEEVDRKVSSLQIYAKENLASLILATKKLINYSPKKNQYLINTYISGISEQLSQLANLKASYNSISCSGDQSKDTTMLLASETKVNETIRNARLEINKIIVSWKYALLIKK